jgi:hypothetical protein
MHPIDPTLRLESLQPPPSLPEGRRDLLRIPWSHAAWKSDRLLDLQLCGDLPAEWALHLARALASRGVSLLNGYARRIEEGIWLAQFDLDLGTHAESEPDFLSLLAGSAEPPCFAEPPILEFELRDSPALGGCLEVQVDAWDAVGLLAAVLSRCAATGLEAEEMILETEGECAFHHLTLKSRRGRRPARLQRLALERALAALRPAG